VIQLVFNKQWGTKTDANIQLSEESDWSRLPIHRVGKENASEPYPCLKDLSMMFIDVY